MENKTLIKILQTLERHTVLLEQYNEQLRTHIKRTEAAEKRLTMLEKSDNKCQGVIQYRWMFLKEVSIFASLVFIAARVFGLI